MTIFRLDVTNVVGADAQLALLDVVTLARTDDGVSLECAVDEGSAASRLARSGVTATVIGAMPRPPAGCIPAHAKDLAPLGCRGVVDVVQLRRLDPGDATARMRVARGRWPFHRPDRDAIRDVLRDDDRVIAWRRVVWARPSVMRSRAMRVVRPVVFDRGGLDDSPERASLATRGDITRWLRG